MDGFWSDCRRAFRILKSGPGVLLVSVLSLALGLGVNLMLFTAIRAVFFYEPTVADAARVVGVRPGNNNQFSYLNWRDLRDSGTFENVAGYRQVSLNLSDGGEPEQIDGLAVTANFFDAVHTPLRLGRAFGAVEAAPERQPRFAVLSQAFWRRRFNANEAIVGHDLTLNGEAFTVLAVLPTGYRPVTLLSNPGVYVPLSNLVFPMIEDRNNGNALNVLGWLRPGMTREQAQAAVTNLGNVLESRYPLDNAGMGQPGRIVPLVGREFGDSPVRLVAPTLLLALFGLVLLSACANVAGLLLAHSATGSTRSPSGRHSGRIGFNSFACCSPRASRWRGSVPWPAHCCPSGLCAYSMSSCCPASARSILHSNPTSPSLPTLCSCSSELACCAASFPVGARRKRTSLLLFRRVRATCRPVVNRCATPSWSVRSPPV